MLQVDFKGGPLIYLLNLSIYGIIYNKQNAKIMLILKVMVI